MRSVYNLCALGLATSTAYALQVDVNSTQSLTQAAKTLASSVAEYYDNATIPGILPDPYYWWESGLAFDTLIHYWALTGDETYNSMVGNGMLWQTGPELDFMPPNQTKSEGNDDQASWALAAMTAAEYGFPMPAGNSQNVTWAQLAQNVFNEQVARWDDENCGGGLRWQIFTFNNGYNYKNSFSNGDFAQLAARLGRFSGNTTYTDWALKAMNWSLDVGLISEERAVYDGTNVNTNCSTVNHVQWTSNLGTYLAASAYGYNLVKNKYWDSWDFSLLSSVGVFVKQKTLYEVACEPNGICNTDQLAFKGILVRGLVAARDLGLDTETYRGNLTAIQAPTGTTRQTINGILRASAQGAAAACSGGESGNECGFKWTTGEYDDSYGLGQNLNALEVMLANLPSIPLRDINSTGSATGNFTSGGSVPCNNASCAPIVSNGGNAGAFVPAAGSMLGLAVFAAMVL